MRFDSIIVGGGPIGGFIAGVLSAKGFSVLLLEEHPRPGQPVQCAGLVTTKLENILDFNDCKLNTVNGAHIYSPSGHRLVLDGGKPKAYVIDRSEFDKQILERAVDSGALLKFGAKVTSVQRIENDSQKVLAVTVSTAEGSSDYRCNLLIGADGANSSIRQMFKFPQPKLMLKGIGMEFEFNNMPPDFVQIFSGNEIAPGFFAWAIPAESHTRIGLCIMENNDNIQDYFNRFVKICQNRELIPEGKLKPSRTITGRIPLGYLERTTSDNVMLVGDAAAQVKPTSGGGLYPGLKCARICSNTAISALEEGDVSNEFLVNYHHEWHKASGTELERGLRLHKAFMHLSDEKIEEAFNILDKPDILQVISNKGDIESPFQLAKLLFKKAPKLIKFAGPYFRSAF